MDLRIYGNTYGVLRRLHIKWPMHGWYLVIYYYQRFSHRYVTLENIDTSSRKPCTRVGFNT